MAPANCELAVTFQETCRQKIVSPLSCDPNVVGKLYYLTRQLALKYMVLHYAFTQISGWFDRDGNALGVFISLCREFILASVWGRSAIVDPCNWILVVKTDCQSCANAY
jgi:hypothetical protein